MKEHPIIMSPESIRAYIDGRKTQTRRVVKYITALGEPENWCHKIETVEKFAGEYQRFCPYGKPGDRIWFKEKIQRDFLSSEITGTECSVYSADFAHTPADAWPWKRDVLSAMYCPRGLSRFNPLITDIRVERLQDITPEDAKEEGDKERSGFPEFYEYGKMCHVNWYRRIWDIINAKRGYPWESNPWVWVIEFERYCE